MVWTAEDERRWKLDFTERYLPGWIQDWYYNPCLPTPTIMIKASFLAVAKLGLDLFPVEDPEHIDRKELYHWATGKTWLKSAKMIGEDYGMRDAYYLAGTELKRWAFFEVVDQLIWKGFVADMVDETMANWTSMIFTMSGCQHAPGHLVGESSNPFGVGYVYKDRWVDMGEFVECKGDFGDRWTPSLTPEPGGYASITCSVQANTLLGDVPLPIEVAICETETGAALVRSTYEGLLGKPSFSDFAIATGYYRPKGTANGIVARIRLSESWPEDFAEFNLVKGHCTLDQLPPIHPE